MNSARIIFMVFVITTYSIFNVSGVDKYTDGNRPYEFGFTIDGEQHRHEKKDENGIIMGEFGFITADGVYHVTVYATDENGRFKILSMKNIRVKPYPTAATQSSRTGHSLSLERAQKDMSSSSAVKVPNSATPQSRQLSTVPNQLINDQNTQSRPTTLQTGLPPASPVKSCSHCSLPKTTTLPPKLPEKIPQTYYAQTDQNNKNINQYNENNNGYQNTYQSKQGAENTLNKNALPTFDNGQGNAQRTFGDLPKTMTSPNQQSDNDQFYNGLKYENALPNSTQYSQQYEGRPSYNSNNNNGIISQAPINPYQSSVSQQASPQDFNSGITIQKTNTEQTQQSPASTYSTQNQGLELPKTTNNQAQGSMNQEVPQTSQGYPQGERSTSSLSAASSSGDRNPKRFEPSIKAEPQNTLRGTNINTYDTSNLGPQKTPMLISAQMQVVDKNTDIYRKNPGESDGLPEGVTKDYMMRVLYVFNYTVGFHGHYEKGFSDGSKQGYYYVTGRNGVKTRVDYEADEKGFRPKITQEVLDILSDDVPKPETEKEPKYGLKSYEFKWLYFPVDSKHRK